MRQLFLVFVVMLRWQTFASLFYPEHPRNHKGLELASFFCTREVSERKGSREFIPEKEFCQLMRGVTVSVRAGGGEAPLFEVWLILQLSMAESL